MNPAITTADPNADTRRRMYEWRAPDGKGPQRITGITVSVALLALLTLLFVGGLFFTWAVQQDKPLSEAIQ